MKKNFLIVCVSLGLTMTAHAQIKVGNNPTTLNPSAALEVEATNKGFLPPRVALQSTSDVVTIPSPATGMLVVSTQNAGSGNTAITSNTLYIWDGSQWSRIVTNNNNNNNSSGFNIGETRSCVIKVDASSFLTNGGSRVVMTGKGSNNTSTTNRKAASEEATNSPSFLVVNGLRLDFMRSVVPAATHPIAPKLYNTTSSPIMYNISSLSTADANTTGSGATIAPNAYSFNIDGDDIFATSYQGYSEYVNSMLTFPDGQWYLCTWHAVREASTFNFFTTVQRLN